MSAHGGASVVICMPHAPRSRPGWPERLFISFPATNGVTDCWPPSGGRQRVVLKRFTSVHSTIAALGASWCMSSHLFLGWGAPHTPSPLCPGRREFAVLVSVVKTCSLLRITYNQNRLQGCGRDHAVFLSAKWRALLHVFQSRCVLRARNHHLTPWKCWG